MAARCVDGRGISALSGISREQAEGLAGMFDEDMLLRRPDLERTRGITGPSFADKDLDALAGLYLYLLMTKISDAARRDVESGIGLDGDKRKLLAGVAEKMRGAVDAGKVEANLTLNAIKCLGHPYIARLQVYTEFRPLSTDGAIKRLAPHLLADGTAHADGGAASQQIRFQMDRATARHFVKNLQTGIDSLDDEIKDMHSKFGDDAVLD